jgi:hypothetical protein
MEGIKPSLMTIVVAEILIQKCANIVMRRLPLVLLYNQVMYVVNAIIIAR